jgi:Lysyl oxidase
MSRSLGGCQIFEVMEVDMTNVTLNRGLICSALLTLWLVSLTGTARAQTQPATDPGALISMNMKGTVGVLLDEVPAGAWREMAARDALQRQGNDPFWVERAKRQVRLTFYRLVFRGFYYPPGKGPLPLPPKSGWQIVINDVPRRAKVGSHDFVLQDYTFQAHILSDPASPAGSEPQLATIGGTWSEPFLLPMDPDLLLERTGYACMDEFEFPPFSVFEQSTSYFYDQTCQVETPRTSSCHVTVFPNESCQHALTSHSGLLQTTMDFMRIPWNPALADQVRFPGIPRSSGADVAVIGDALSQENAIYYRYFAPDACEIVEKCVAKPGWRRFLSFSANVRNDGDHDIDLGDVTDPNNPWRIANAVEFSTCHQHFHFSHYGTFQYGSLPGSKKAFCLEDTDRTHNDELTSLTPNHQSCQFQGITTGWGDEYQFGLPCQGVDITDADTNSTNPADATLSFTANPDQFICEGFPVLDSSGNLIFDPTSFTSESGLPVSRERCNFTKKYAANNFASANVSASDGASFVSSACQNGELGPLRDCGFTVQPIQVPSCTAGRPVHLSCKSAYSPQVVRVCEKSEALGGVDCTYRDSLADVIATPGGTNVSFTCPVVRDASVSGTGGFSVYIAPLLSSQPVEAITCVQLK